MVQPSDELSGANTDNSALIQTTSSISRRRLIRSGIGAGALAFGLFATGTVGAKPGQVGAPGKGGEAVVPVSNFKDEQFHINKRIEPPETVIFECNEGIDRPILLVGWDFEYVSGETGILYTRDNNVQTGEDVIYNWNGNGNKRCSPATANGDFIQTPYRGRNVR